MDLNWTATAELLAGQAAGALRPVSFLVAAMLALACAERIPPDFWEAQNWIKTCPE